MILKPGTLVKCSYSVTEHYGEYGIITVIDREYSTFGVLFFKTHLNKFCNSPRNKKAWGIHHFEFIDD